MSLADLDRIGALQRMEVCLKPEDLDDGACLDLATELLSGMAEDLTRAARRYAEFPTEENMSHLKSCRNLYKSDLFAALSCGTVDGEVAARKIIKDALRGKRLE